jgi:hypothetical protein
MLTAPRPVGEVTIVFVTLLLVGHVCDVTNLFVTLEA